MSDLRVALAGYGDVATVHLEAIDTIDGAELVGICDTDGSARERAVSVAGVPSFVDVYSLIRETQPDVLHVTTPHSQHAALTAAALEMGVHVLQEKPLAHSLGDGMRIVHAAEAAAEAGTKIGICFQNRYNVSSQQAAKLIAAGAIGEITGAYASVVWTRTDAYYTSRPWRGTWAGSGGGLLINQAIHTLDLVQWLVGDVVDIDGQTSTRRYGHLIEVEDTAEAVFTHANGAQTTFYATLTAPTTHPVEVEIVGSEGTLLIRDGLTLTSPRGTVERWDERKASSAGRTYWGVSHELLIRDFYQRIPEPEPFWISPAEAMKSLRILKSLYGRRGASEMTGWAGSAAALEQPGSNGVLDVELANGLEPDSSPEWHQLQPHTTLS